MLHRSRISTLSLALLIVPVLALAQDFCTAPRVRSTQPKACADMTRAKLHDQYLSGMDLRGVKLLRAELHQVNMSHSDLRQADLQLASMRQANLQHANLQNANLREARLYQADLRGADLRGANLRRARLTGCQLQGALFDASTVLPFGKEVARQLGMVERPLPR